MVNWHGTTLNGKATGLGGYKSQNGDEWFGHYINDLKCGRSRTLRGDGNVQITEHKDGKIHGKCTMYINGEA